VVRKEAAWALGTWAFGEINDDKMVDALTHVAQNDEEMEVREVASAALKKLRAS
jgi:HEAT repeat protein